MPIRTRTRIRTTLALAAATATALAVTGLTSAVTATAAELPAPRTDFNHDGYADLAVGLPNASVSGIAKAG